MTNGYQQFFKKARENAESDGPSQFKSKPKVTRKFDLKNASANASATRKFNSERRTESRTDTRQALMDELHLRLKKKPVKAKKRIPLRVLVTSLIGLAVSVAGLLNAEIVEKYAKKVEISMMSYAGAEEKPTKSEKPSVADAKGTEAKAEVAPPVELAKKEYTEEEINHFSKLNERKRELDAREEELNRLEQELAKQKTDLEKRLKDLESTRRQISSVLEEKVQADDKKVESLVQMYSNMKPQQAAKIFETMDEDLAIDILGRMKKKPAAEILNLVKAEKAQVLSEKFAGYKRP